MLYLEKIKENAAYMTPVKLEILSYLKLIVEY